MTFEQLQYFSEIYQKKSITKASENLYVSRQALSFVIKKLETELNVKLFERTATGVEPTEAGDILYRSAQIILNEESILRQEILQYSEKLCSKNICKVGIAEAIMAIYGQKLYDNLSEAFPNISFDFYPLLKGSNDNFYSKYDITICISSEKNRKKYSEALNPEYVIKHISKLPVYVWISSASELSKHTPLSFEALKDTPCCIFRNTFNSKAILTYLSDFGYNLYDINPTVAIEKNFVERVEKFGYFAIDLRINDKLFYSDLFKNKKVTLRQTPNVFYLEIIFNKKISSNFYTIISNILAQ